MIDEERTQAKVVGDQAFAEYRDTVAGVRRGLAEARAGLGQSGDEVFDAIEDRTPSKKRPLPVVTAR
jgi:hypothetical protein